MPEKPFKQSKTISVKRVSDTHTTLLKKAHTMAIVARHAERTKPSRELNESGIRRAYKRGTNLPKDMNLIPKASPSPRAMHTVELSRLGYIGEKVKNIDFEKIAKEYALDVLGEIDGSDQPIEELIGVGKEYFRMQFSEILKNRASLKTSDKKPLYLNVSHEGIDLALFAALGLVKSKEDIQKMFPKIKGVDPKLSHTQTYAEGVLFYFLNDGRIVVSYRKQRFDVTSVIQRILSDPKARFERQQFYLKLAEKYPFAKKYFQGLAKSF